MKIYTGSMLHGVNKQNIAPGELGETVSLDLGMIPEDVIKEKVFPLVKSLNDILSEYNVYFWTTMGHFENKEEQDITE